MFEQETDYSFVAIIVFVFMSIFFIVSCVVAQDAKPVENEKQRFELAAAYSKENRGLSFVVMKGGKIVFEEYQNGFSAKESHLLASGTKSFNGIMAAAAIEDGLIKNFDEKISDTITEWKTDKRKSAITLRQLLSLTAGLDVGNNGRPPTYADAVKFPAKFDSGTTFEYGPVPFQVFGEVMRRKLLPKKETVLDYMKRRIFDLIGLKVADWTMQEGQPDLPSGAYLSALDWLKFGQLLKNEGKWDGKQVIEKKYLRELWNGSKANPNYGLTFWLNSSSNGEANIAKTENARVQRLRDFLNIQSDVEEVSKNGFGKDLPRDMFVAAGAGKQRLYVIPSLDLVIVRQGRQSRFDDTEFLSRLLLGRKSD